MNKCPYCGAISENQMCDQCHAMIPEDNAETPKEKPVTRKRHKEMKENGT